MATSNAGGRGGWLASSENRERATVLTIAFATLLLLKWPALAQPPAWDAAMSIHPAAIVLSKNGFDVSGLLQQGGFLQGGPNSHVLSVVTFLTAFCYRWLSGSELLFPAMHVGHVAVSAFAAWATFRLGRPVLGRRLAALVTVAAFCYPTVLAQTGCLYLEMPLLACTQMALVAWSGRRFVAAALWALLGTYVKETALIVAGALVLAALVERGPWRQRLGRAALVLVPVVGAFYINTIAATPPEAAPYHPPSVAEYLRWNVGDRSRRVPDLAALFALSLLATAARGRSAWSSLREAGNGEDPSADSASSRSLGLAHALILSFLAFFVAAPFVTEVFLLPRYFIQILPCMLIVLVAALSQATSARVAALTTAVFVALFLANRHGAFYPREDVNDGSIAERSEEYADLVELHKQIGRALEEVSADVPVFYGYPEHFLVSYPEMGYVKNLLANGHCIALEEPYKHARLGDFPPQFCLVFDYPAMGGEMVYSVATQAKEAGWRARRVAQGHSGDHQFVLIELSEPSPPASSMPAAPGG